MKGRLVVISGPSGAGKGTVLKNLFKLYPNVVYSVSVTTRQPREGEVEGRDYFFRTYEEFKAMSHRGEFLETAEVYGNYYGTPTNSIMKLINVGLDVLLEIDTVGALNIKRNYIDAVLIFIIPPHIDILKRQLNGRNTETIEQLSMRINEVEKEIHKVEEYDYLVINNAPEQAAEDIYCILRAERCLVKNNESALKNFLEVKNYDDRPTD